MTNHATHTLDHYIALMKWQVLSWVVLVVGMGTLILVHVVPVQQPQPAPVAHDIELLAPPVPVLGGGTGLPAFVSSTTGERLRSVLTDESDSSSALVFATSPTLTTPTLGLPPCLFPESDDKILDHDLGPCVTTGIRQFK